MASFKLSRCEGKISVFKNDCRYTIVAKRFYLYNIPFRISATRCENKLTTVKTRFKMIVSYGIVDNFSLSLVQL